MLQKTRGRPRGFDRDKALLDAIDVFWAKGYDGTSMKDLTEAMGIKAPSLYATFGDKHSLYLQAIDRYTSDESCAPLVAFESEPDIYKAVVAFMNAVVDYSTQKDSGTLGCFLSSCVATSAGVVDGAQSRLKQAIKETDIRISKRFDIEKTNGQLASDFPSMERARLMFDLRQGLVFRARSGISQQAMKKDIQERAKMVLFFAGQ